MVLAMHTDSERRLIYEIAAETMTDPRSVARELAAQRGADRHVRGCAGARIRDALARRGLQPHVRGRCVTTRDDATPGVETVWRIGAPGLVIGRTVPPVCISPPRSQK